MTKNNNNDIKIFVKTTTSFRKNKFILYKSFLRTRTELGVRRARRFHHLQNFSLTECLKVDESIIKVSCFRLGRSKVLEGKGNPLWNLYVPVV